MFLSFSYVFFLFFFFFLLHFQFHSSCFLLRRRESENTKTSFRRSKENTKRVNDGRGRHNRKLLSIFTILVRHSVVIKKETFYNDKIGLSQQLKLPDILKIFASK